MDDQTQVLNLQSYAELLKNLAAQRTDLAREYMRIATEISTHTASLAQPSDIVQASGLVSDCVLAALALEPIQPDSGIFGNDVRSSLEATVKSLVRHGEWDRAAQLLERVVAVSPGWGGIAARIYMNMAELDMAGPPSPGGRELGYVARALALDSKTDITHLVTRHAELAANSGAIEDGEMHLRRGLEIFEKYNPQGSSRRTVLAMLSGLLGTGARATGFLGLAYRAARAANFVQAEGLLMESLRIAVVLDQLSRFLHARTAATVYDSFIDLAEKRGDKKSAARMRQNQKALSHRVEEFVRSEHK